MRYLEEGEGEGEWWTYKEMRYFALLVDGFGLGGVDVEEVGVRVDEVAEIAAVVEDFTEVVKDWDEEVLVELAAPGMHWPGGVSVATSTCSGTHRGIL